MQPDSIEQVRTILNSCDAEQQAALVKLLRSEFRTHPIEREWNTSAEIVLEALARSSPLTKRMFKGILAEAAFKVEVIDKLDGWRDVTPDGNHAYDFAIDDGGGTATIQAKLQRKVKHQPMMYPLRGRRGEVSQFYVVETQKTRAGKSRSPAAPSEDEETRPYRFGEFDILAVSMEPATQDWSQFRYTVGNWLLPRADNDHFMASLQPVSLEPNEDWTNCLATAVRWHRSGERKRISFERAAEGSGLYPNQ